MPYKITLEIRFYDHTGVMHADAIKVKEGECFTIPASTEMADVLIHSEFSPAPHNWQCDTHDDYMTCIMAPAHFMHDYECT